MLAQFTFLVLNFLKMIVFPPKEEANVLTGTLTIPDDFRFGKANGFNPRLRQKGGRTFCTRAEARCSLRANKFVVLVVIRTSQKLVET